MIKVVDDSVISFTSKDKKRVPEFFEPILLTKFLAYSLKIEQFS